MIYVIKSDKLEVSIDSFGAQINSVKFNGVERTWQNDSGEWEDHAPVLFPWCGHFEVKVYERKYPESVHGLAINSNFAVIEQKDNSIRFSISSSKETKKYYPYDFIFDVIYTVEGDTLKVDYEVGNPTDYEIYFACGAHDSFYTFDRLIDCAIEFEKEEDLHRVYADDNGLVYGEEKIYPKTKVFPFPKDRVEIDLSLIFKGLESEYVNLLNAKGEKLATIYLGGLKNLLCWASPNGEYICIEPWSNLPDRVEGNTEEFYNRYGVMNLPPKQKAIIKRAIKYY